MAGRGEVPAEQQAHPRVFTINKEGEWVPALDPIHFDKDIAGVGAGPTFGAVMADRDENITIGLIPCAVGATSITTWVPGGYHKPTGIHPWNDALERTRQAMQDGTLKGILWNQGEADTKNIELASAYQERLDSLIIRFRGEFGEDIPIIVAQLPEFFSSKRQFAEYINTAVTTLPTRFSSIACVDTKGLICKTDSIHYNSASYRILGQRYAEKMIELLEKDL